MKKSPFSSDNTKIVQHSDMHGKKLSMVSVWEDGLLKDYPCATRVPGALKLMNFDVKAGSQAFLVLDNYGDEVLPAKTMRRVIGHDLFAWNLAINRSDGTFHIATFAKEGTQYAMLISRLYQGEALPRKFLGRLDELKSKKRPYFVTCWEECVWSFIDKEGGYSALRENLVVDLNFDRRRVQVWGNSYREVTSWM
jgi:hypothetical protein